jgi:hypothetical protein
MALDDYWNARASKIAASRAWRPKLLCLESYLPDHTLARDLYQSWGTLSRACHVHPYELDPTSDELEGWIDDVAVLTEHLQGFG